MKTRIKIVTDPNGVAKHYPQFRSWGIWHSFEMRVRDGSPDPVVCDTMDEAKIVIDNALIHESSLIRKTKNVGTDKVSFVEYPEPPFEYPYY